MSSLLPTLRAQFDTLHAKVLTTFRQIEDLNAIAESDDEDNDVDTQARRSLYERIIKMARTMNEEVLKQNESYQSEYEKLVAGGVDMKGEAETVGLWLEEFARWTAKLREREKECETEIDMLDMGI